MNTSNEASPHEQIADATDRWCSDPEDGDRELTDNDYMICCVVIKNRQTSEVDDRVFLVESDRQCHDEGDELERSLCNDEWIVATCGVTRETHEVLACRAFDYEFLEQWAHRYRPVPLSSVRSDDEDG